ncbi:MAG: hypothetical protein HXS49_01775 [Theionarchaea archaeon]|nr:hypothetical protein [Theionarchaea archaeon]MBU7033886.1 hypothetical protein [Theionarchaea archaeon]
MTSVLLPEGWVGGQVRVVVPFREPAVRKAYKTLVYHNQDIEAIAWDNDYPTVKDFHKGKKTHGGFPS